MIITKLLENSSVYCEELHDLLHGVELPDDQRSCTSAACLHLALEHQRAVLLLYGKPLPVSAGALLRPQVEAYVKGAWLSRCAKDAQVTRFLKDREPKTFGNMVSDLEAVGTEPPGELSAIKMQAWRALSNYIHSGAAQVSRRISESEIIGRYTTAEVVGGLLLSNRVGFLVGVELANIAGNEELARQIARLYGAVDIAAP